MLLYIINLYLQQPCTVPIHKARCLSKWKEETFIWPSVQATNKMSILSIVFLLFCECNVFLVTESFETPSIFSFKLLITWEFKWVKGESRWISLSKSSFDIWVLSIQMVILHLSRDAGTKFSNYVGALYSFNYCH